MCLRTFQPVNAKAETVAAVQEANAKTGMGTATRMLIACQGIVESTIVTGRGSLVLTVEMIVACLQMVMFRTVKKNSEKRCLRPRLHEQIKQHLFEQIRPGLLHTDREFEQLKKVLFAYVNAA